MAATRFDHIALAVPRIADAAPVLVAVLGAVPHHGGTAEAYRFAQWRVAGGGRLELLEPVGPDGFLQRFLARHGPGVHHVTFKVPDLAARCDRARALGHEIVGYDDTNPRWKQAFLHPRDALGIVVQLVETAAGPRRRSEAAAPPPEGAARVLGLRLRARSAERARQQWGQLLEGTERPAVGGTLVYRWPDSPLRLAVELEPAAPEGPVAVELAAAGPVALPAGRHPVLGTPFVVLGPEAP